MFNSFDILYYYLFDLDNIIIKVIKSNNSIIKKSDKEKNQILERLNLLVD
jgi:hypothetical protein